MLINVKFNKSGNCHHFEKGKKIFKIRPVIVILQERATSVFLGIEPRSENLELI